MKQLKIKFDYENNKIILNRNPVTEEEIQKVWTAMQDMTVRRFLMNPGGAIIYRKEKGT